MSFATARITLPIGPSNKGVQVLPNYKELYFDDINGAVPSKTVDREPTSLRCLRQHVLSHDLRWNSISSRCCYVTVGRESHTSSQGDPDMSRLTSPQVSNDKTILPSQYSTLQKKQLPSSTWWSKSDAQLQHYYNIYNIHGGARSLDLLPTWELGIFLGLRSLDTLVNKTPLDAIPVPWFIDQLPGGGAMVRRRVRKVTLNQ